MRISTVSVFELFLIRLSGESLAQINPTNVIAGDTMKAVLLRRKGVEYTSSIVSLTVYRFISILAVATFIIAGIVVFFDYIGVFATKQTICIVIACFILCNIGMFYRIQSRKGIFSLIIPLFRVLSGRSGRLDKTIEKLREIDSELSDFFRAKKLNFIGAYVYSLLHRLPEVFEYYVIFSFLDMDVSMLSCLAVSVGVTVFKALGSFIPGQLGIEEYGNKVMLDFIKVTGSSTWLSVSILRRSRQLVWIILGSAAFFIIAKRTGKSDVDDDAGE